MSAVARDADVYRKMTASPADCVRTSQAGTKLDRTQTAEELLSSHANISSQSRHDIFIGALGVSGTAVTAGC